MAVLVTIFALLPAAIGLSGRILLPESNGKGILYEMANRLSPGWGGLASIAILGAVLSTGPAILLMLATTVVRDIYLNIKPKASDKKQIPLRLSSKLYDAIAAWAEDDFRSVNGQIEYLLTECVRQRKKNGKYVSDEIELPPELEIKEYKKKRAVHISGWS